MKRKTWYLSISILVIFLICYISVGIWIQSNVKLIAVNGMKNDLSYKEYMTERAYTNINPAMRGMGNYEKHYIPNNHTYSNTLPWHLFFVAKATINHYYDKGNMGFNEEIEFTLKLRKGKWIATDVKIEP